MFGLTLINAFVSLIFFKVAIDAMFDQDLSIMAALMMAVTFSTIAWFATAIFVGKMASNIIDEKESTATTERNEFIKTFLAAGVIGIFLNFVLTFAFSKKLWREIYRDLNSTYSPDFLYLWFAIISSIPFFVAAICIYRVWRQIPKDDL